MIGVYNQLGIHVACLGNHDLDFGVKRISELVGQTGPSSWLISNIVLNQQHPESGHKVWVSPGANHTRVGGLLRYHVISNWKDTGLKIGFMGLAEKEWSGCISHKAFPEGFEI